MLHFYILVMFLYFTPKVGTSVPWDPACPPPLNQIPFCDSFPANMYKRDTFHVVKHGIGREMVASTLVLLSNMGYFDFDNDTKNLPDRLHRGYMMFKLWCGSENKSPSLKNFTKANLHVTGSPFPYLGGKDQILHWHLCSCNSTSLPCTCRRSDMLITKKFWASFCK